MTRSGKTAAASAAAIPRSVSDLQAELNALLDSVDQGVLLFGPTGRLRASSAGFAKMFGVEPGHLRDCANLESLVELLAPRFRDPHKFAQRWLELHARREEAAWDKLELVKPARKLLERFARPVFGPGGQRLGWLEVYRDVTGDGLIQSRLLQTEKMAAIGQLVSGIAHELNNPLTSILGYAQLLLGRQRAPAAGPGPTFAEQQIFNEAWRAARIVRNLLLFARETEPQRIPVSLNEIVERTLALRNYDLRLGNIAVELDLDQGLPLTLADPHQLQQVLLNLLVNAEHALEHHHGAAHIRIRTAQPSRRRLLVEVADDGPGIPSEIAARIFDPFFTTKPVGVGTGLGLSIARQVVREHRGEIYLQPRPRSGACFVVELPVVVPPAGRVSWPPASLKGGVTRRLLRPTARRVLVVEDEPTVAQLVSDIMGGDGHHVETLSDGEQALERILRAAPPFELIICDLKMPRLDGFALHRALLRRNHPALQRMLFITGDTLSRRTLEFLESSGVPYLAKPFLVEELRQAIHNCLQLVAPQGSEERNCGEPEKLRTS